MKKTGAGFALKCTFLVSCLAVGLTLLFADDTSDRLLFINESLQYLGTPYKYASASKTGTDCSGLVYMSALQSVNIKLPRSASAIAKFAKRITAEDMQAGDLVFFNTFGTGVSHVGIYLGGDQFIHSASAGKVTGVITSSLDETYWENRYLFAGRILPKEDMMMSVDEILQQNETPDDKDDKSEKTTESNPEEPNKAKTDKDRVKEIVSSENSN